MDPSMLFAIGFIVLYIVMVAGFYLLYNSMIRKALHMEEDFVAPLIVRMATIALAFVSPSFVAWILSMVLGLIGLAL